jgi:hypothetical protein
MGTFGASNLVQWGDAPSSSLWRYQQVSLPTNKYNSETIGCGVDGTATSTKNRLQGSFNLYY